HAEGTLEGDPAVRLHGIGRTPERRLTQLDLRVDRVADVPDPVPVEIRLVGVGDRRAVVVVVADDITVEIAATRRGAGTRLAGVGQRADEELTVIARGAIRLVRVRADPGPRIADPGVVALIEGRADHRVRAGADAGLADVGLGARVA